MYLSATAYPDPYSMPEPDDIPESEITRVIDDWLGDFSKVDEYVISLKEDYYLAASVAITNNDAAELMKAYRDGLRVAMRDDAIKHIERRVRS